MNKLTERYHLRQEQVCPGPIRVLFLTSFAGLGHAENCLILVQAMPGCYSIALCIRLSSSIFCFILTCCSFCASCLASSCSLYWFSSASLRSLLATSCSFFNL